MKTPKTPLKARVEQHPVVFFAVTLIVGFTAGIGTYEAILRIAQLEPTARSELRQLHIRAARASAGPASAAETHARSIRITAPRSAQEVPWAFDVEGSSDGFPEGYHLWLLTTDLSGPSPRYWPQERVFPRADKTWRGRVYGIGGEPGARRTFGVFLVGPDGQALLELWKAAANPRLAIPRLTRDTHTGTEVDVVVKSGRPQDSGEQ